MFAYCGNKPVNRVDLNGYFWGSLLAGVGAVITVAVAAVAILTVVAIVDVAIQEYRNHHVTYADSSSDAEDINDSTGTITITKE
ncbi:hypothetical protein SH2C18_15110 [Clostridium sediminicola]|uniref:hypothetical protein n=1 Tax=Clostridium sediminicola TaxID=3114879 RepID=UPI0031F1E266